MLEDSAGHSPSASCTNLTGVVDIPPGTGQQLDFKGAGALTIPAGATYIIEVVH